MREHFEIFRTAGTLFLNNKLFKKNSELEFKDNYYNNFFDIGKIKTDYLSAEFLNSFVPNKHLFKFIDNENRTFLGIITGIQLNSEIYSHSHFLKVRLFKYQQHCQFEKFKSNSITTTFKIPFSYMLSRRIESSFGFNDEYIVRFQKTEFIINIDNVIIKFKEPVYFLKVDKPNKLFCRDIAPTIVEIFRNKRNLIPYLNKKEKLMTDVMLIISFLLFHKMDWYGYKSELMDKNNRMHEFIEYKEYTKKIGEDYLYEDKMRKFDIFFTSKIVSSLIKNYRLMKNNEKKKISQFIGELLLIKNKNSYKSRFLESLFLVESICQYIVTINTVSIPSSKGFSQYQEKIKAAIKCLKIPMSEIGFRYSNTLTKSNKKLWVITDYRNQIAHSDLKPNFNWQKSRQEYLKLMKLIRRLILILIDSKYQNIPYPEEPF